MKKYEYVQVLADFDDSGLMDLALINQFGEQGFKTVHSMPMQIPHAIKGRMIAKMLFIMEREISNAN